MPYKMGDGGYDPGFKTPMNTHPGGKGQPDPMNVPLQRPRDPLGIQPKVNTRRRDSGGNTNRKGK